MRAELTELRGTVAMLVSLMQDGRAIPATNPGSQNDGHSRLTDAEREYRIDRQEFRALLGVSERTFYRRLKDYGFTSVRENGDTKFILGEVTDKISRHGLSWHRSALDRILYKRSIKSKRSYV